MFHQNPLTVETLWLTKPERIFTLFLISQNVAVLFWLVILVVGLIDIQQMQSVIKGFFFLFFSSKIATILVICKPDSSSWAWFCSLFFIRKFHIELCHSRPTTYLQHLKNCHFHTWYPLTIYSLLNKTLKYALWCTHLYCHFFSHKFI